MANKKIKMSSGPCHSITAELFFGVLRVNNLSGGEMSFNLAVHVIRPTAPAKVSGYKLGIAAKESISVFERISTVIRDFCLANTKKSSYKYIGNGELSVL